MHRKNMRKITIFRIFLAKIALYLKYNANLQVINTKKKLFIKCLTKKNISWQKKNLSK